MNLSRRLPYPIRQKTDEWSPVGNLEHVFYTEHGHVVIQDASEHGYKCLVVTYREGTWQKRTTRPVVMNAAVMAKMRRENQYQFARDLTIPR